MNWQGKTILITGGAGSLGKSLTKKLLDLSPKMIRIFSRDELKHQRMKAEFDNHKLRFLIGDIRDKERLARAMEGVDYVFHLAAMKHVDVCESNPLECIATNVTGSVNVAEAAIKSGVERVLAISSDKAVDPCNIYGASKLMMEGLFKRSDYFSGNKVMLFSSLRLVNILDSSGNVFEVWSKKLKQDKSLPVTHKDMARAFITSNDAVEAMIEAMNRLEPNGVFTYRGAKNYKICDIAKLLGEVEEIGMRLGERLEDPLVADWEVRFTKVVTQNLFFVGCLKQPQFKEINIRSDLNSKGDPKELYKLIKA